MITKMRNQNRKSKKINVDNEMQREPAHTLRTKVQQLKTNVVKSGRKLSDRFCWNWEFYWTFVVRQFFVREGCVMALLLILLFPMMVLCELAKKK